MFYSQQFFFPLHCVHRCIKLSSLFGCFHVDYGICIVLCYVVNGYAISFILSNIISCSSSILQSLKACCIGVMFINIMFISGYQFYVIGGISLFSVVNCTALQYQFYVICGISLFTVVKCTTMQYQFYVIDGISLLSVVKCTTIQYQF